MVKDTEIYCFDTSALVGSWRRYYLPGTFGQMWDQIYSMVESGSILIPKEVKKEICNGKDDLVDWMKKLDRHVVPIDEKQLKIVSEIVNKYPAVSQYKKPRPFHADPFVVAVAKIHKCTVVTFERKNGSKENPAIPDLCDEYNVNHKNMTDFFRKLGWQFKIST